MPGALNPQTRGLACRPGCQPFLFDQLYDARDMIALSQALLTRYPWVATFFLRLPLCC